LSAVIPERVAQVIQIDHELSIREIIADDVILVVDMPKASEISERCQCAGYVQKSHGRKWPRKPAKECSHVGCAIMLPCHRVNLINKFTIREIDEFNTSIPTLLVDQ
jgi:hypothetical protein